MGRGGADDQEFEIGIACRIAGRAGGGGSGWCGRSGHGIRVARKGERWEGEVAGGALVNLPTASQRILVHQPAPAGGESHPVTPRQG